jgi:hypothetical protein
MCAGAGGPEVASRSKNTRAQSPRAGKLPSRRWGWPGASVEGAAHGSPILLGFLLSRRPWRNDHQDWRVVGDRRKLRGEAMIDNRTQVFDVAMKNARTIEACVDRLAMIGADHELKLIARRLSRLTFRAEPSEEALLQYLIKDPA